MNHIILTKLSLKPTHLIMPSCPRCNRHCSEDVRHRIYSNLDRDIRADPTSTFYHGVIIETVTLHRGGLILWRKAVAIDLVGRAGRQQSPIIVVIWHQDLRCSSDHCRDDVCRADKQPSWSECGRAKLSSLVTKRPGGMVLRGSPRHDKQVRWFECWRTVVSGGCSIGWWISGIIRGDRDSELTTWGKSGATVQSSLSFAVHWRTILEHYGGRCSDAGLTLPLVPNKSNWYPRLSRLVSTT